MADRVVRGRAVVRSSPRRAMQWIASTQESVPTSLGAASVVLDQSFAFGEDATITRIRGKLWVASDQVAASEQPFGAIGMAVVTNQALAIGVTAVPTPITDQASDEWFLWEPWFADIAFADATGFIQKFRQIEFDSKAMRKVNDGLSVIVALENSSSAHGANYLLEFRMLVKLH